MASIVMTAVASLFTVPVFSVFLLIICDDCDSKCEMLNSFNTTSPFTNSAILFLSKVNLRPRMDHSFSFKSVKSNNNKKKKTMKMSSAPTLTYT